MPGFLRDWLKNAWKWFVWATTAAVAVAIVVTVSHALAWAGQTYGGTILLAVVVVLCALVVVGGSAVQTCRQRKGPAGSP